MFHVCKYLILNRITESFEKGKNQKDLNLLTLDAKGLIFITIETEQGEITTINFVKE